MSGSYSVVLSHGGHTVRAEDAERILDAIQNDSKLVTVEVELYPGSKERRPLTLVTAHVMTVSPLDEPGHDAGSARTGKPALRLVN